MASLSSRGSFWAAAAVAGLGAWASGAPAMVFPLYAVDWHLSSVVITSIFAVYPISLVVVMIFFGNVSDYIGRRAALLLGVTAIGIGILLFALAPNVVWLFVGRAFQGIGLGLAASPASAAMAEFVAGGNTRRASAINTAATAVGLAIATILGGALVQYAPLPLHLSYWVTFVISVGLFILVSFMPRRVPGTAAEGRWHPGGVRVPKGLGRVFVISSVSILAGLSMGSLFLSLGAQISNDLVRSDNALVSGVIIAITAIAIGGAAILGRGLDPKRAIIWGGISGAVGMLLFVLSALYASIVFFIAGSLIAGIGYGLLFLGALTLANRNAPAHHRAQTLSAIYLVAYLGQGIIAVAIGLSATATGLGFATNLWSPIIAAICLIALILVLALGGAKRLAPVAS
jgi:MFS family permease